MKTKVSVCFESNHAAKTATQFAKQHSLIIKPLDSIATPFTLYFKDEITELIDNENHIKIHVDFISGGLAHRRKYGGGKGQAIAKAIGLKKYKQPLNVLDATTGLAKDAFVLACLGCSVNMTERNPIIAELVSNAIKLAENSDDFQDIKQQGFKLLQTDAINYLEKLRAETVSIRPDIIYIDPMYPERKKSASVKKNMQILQKLIGHENDKQHDETLLFDLALNVAKKRVVIKRPKNAPTLTDKAPSMSIQSKITRYDVYVINSQKNAAIKL